MQQGGAGTETGSLGPSPEGAELLPDRGEDRGVSGSWPEGGLGGLPALLWCRLRGLARRPALASSSSKVAVGLWVSLCLFVQNLPQLHITNPGGSDGKESTCQCRRREFDPWVEWIPWRREGQPTPAFLPRKAHGQWSLAGYCPWRRKESDTTERLNKQMKSTC